MDCEQAGEERQFEDDIPYSAMISPGERIMGQITALSRQVTQLRQEAALKRLPASEACKEWVYTYTYIYIKRKVKSSIAKSPSEKNLLQLFVWSIMYNF